MDLQNNRWQLRLRQAERTQRSPFRWVVCRLVVRSELRYRLQRARSLRLLGRLSQIYLEPYQPQHSQWLAESASKQANPDT